MPPDPSAVSLRAAEPADAEAIAGLHARSWQTAYRGSFSDAYLDGPILAERHTFWTQRMRHPPPGLVTLLAEQPGAPLAGFLCALVDHDPRWGTLVDNLHADPGMKRRGLGRRLLGALAGSLADRGSAMPVHLFVLEANHAAAAFYARLGGETVERTVTTEPDGSQLPVARIVWPTVAALAAGAAEPR